MANSIIMGKPFTPERLAAIRRMRRARRLYKQQPLFAYHILCGIYPGYSYEEFMDDLRYRRPPRRRRGRNNLVRYGRYARMEQLADRYQQTGNAEDALQALRLRRNMTKPYRVMVKVGKIRLEYTFSPLVPIRHIEELVGRLAACGSENEADGIVRDFRKTVHIK
jgi:hypothetical protein